MKIIKRELNTIVASQAKYSPYGQIFLALIVAYAIQGIPYLQWNYYFVTLVIFLNLARIPVLNVQTKIGEDAQKIWFFLFSFFTLGSALAWGVQCAKLIYLYGFSESISVVLMTVIAGLVAGASVTLPPHKWLARGFIFAAIVPPLFSLFISPDKAHTVMGMIAAANLIFLLAQMNNYTEIILKSKSRQDQLKAFADASMEGIMVHDQGRIIEVNKGFEKMFGYSANEVIGKSIHDFAPMDDFVENQFKTYQEANKPIPLRGKKKSGEIFFAEVVGRWFFLENRKVRIVCVQDVTHRHEVENAIREREKAALESAKVKSEFLANMSHEIRTPLNAIIGITDLLSGTAVNDLQKRHLRMLKGSSEGLLNLINDILDFSKIDSGRIELEDLEFNISSVVESQISTLAGRAKQRGIDLHVIIDPQLPQIVRGDYGRLGQVLLNLVNNAIKFTEKGSVRVLIHLLNVHNGKAKIRFEVVDTGMGIQEEDGKKLFRPFTQADSSTARKHGGTGLGLSICHKLVEIMEGEIGFHSQVGVGTTFWTEIAFPVVLAQSIAEKYLRKDWTKARIGVVCENLMITETLACYLKSWDMSFVIKKGENIQIDDVDVLLVDSQKIPSSISEKFQNASEKQRIIFVGEDLSENHHLSRLVVPLPILYSDLFNAITEALSLQVPQDQSHALSQKNIFTGARVLVAEDNSINQMIILATLNQLGLNCHLVGNGAQAIDAYTQSEYDVILMDCQMPEVDGFQATMKIREMEKAKKYKTPIVALTANAFKEDRDRCLESGMNDFLSKPVRKEKLIETLQKYLKTVNAA